MYLVTGGAGFIGSNLVQGLLNRGNDVIIIDNLSTGVAENVPLGAPLILTKVEEGLKRLRGEELDGIFHLGSPPSTPLYFKNPGLVADVLRDFIAVLDAAKKYGVRVIYASSSNVYNGNPLPYREDMPIYPKHFYSEARYYMERLALLYHDFFGVESVGLRFFSVYGYNEGHKGELANLVSRMMWAKEKDEVFKIWGDGSQTRDSVFVLDLVKALIEAMEKPIPFGVYNVGTGRSLTVKELSEIIGCRKEYVPVELANYAFEQQADTTLFESTFGWKPESTVEDWVKCHA